MDRFMVIFVGGVLTFSSSWLGLVIIPNVKLGGERPFTDPGGQSDPYPRPLQGRAAAGRQVYVNLGCLYCHSQQVRSVHFGNWWDEHGQMRTGADIRRGWGTRRTVSRDYIYDTPVMLGTMRTGPDLSTVGRRYSASWQHTHLFNPRSANEWSVMPSFAFLYAREKVLGGPEGKSDRALNRDRGGLGSLGREWTLSPGYRYSPTRTEVKELIRGAWAATFRTDAEPEPTDAAVDRLARLWDAVADNRAVFQQLDEPRLAKLKLPPGHADRNTDVEALAAELQRLKLDPAGPEVRDWAKVYAVVGAWLTTPEENFQVVPTADGDALVEYLLQLNKNEVELPEAKE